MLDTLLTPIPILKNRRDDKLGYRDYPIDEHSPHFGEPLVYISDYGLAGQAYWSRPNRALGRPIKGVDPKIRVRKTIAEKLKKANDFLVSPQITKILGFEVELYIEDGLRTLEHQAYLYNTAFPEHIAANNPSWPKEKVLARRDELSARPPKPGESPTPHMTGSAVDLTIRKKSTDKSYIKELGINLLRKSGSTDETCNPDYAEYFKKTTGFTDEEWQEGVRNRRIMYNLLVDLDMQVNPTELWHWSYGDQMWALLKNQPSAFYGMYTVASNHHSD